MREDEIIIGHILNGVFGEELKSCEMLKGGLTNSSYLVNGKYVFRLPGKDTDKIIDRAHEQKSLELAKELGIDDTYLCMNRIHGWKVSKYLNNCCIPDYHDFEDSKLVIRKLHELHDRKAHVDWEFRPYEDALKTESLLKNKKACDSELKSKIKAVFKSIKDDKAEKCFCHCDIYAPNFLIDKDMKKVTLLDWEYAGESDPAVDVAYYIVDAMYSFNEALKFIKEYLETDDERLVKHYLAYISIVAYYWYVWALFRNECGANIIEARDS